MFDYGLERKSTYQELIKSIEEPKYKIEYPNRVALGIVNSPYFNFFGDETFIELEQQSTQKNISDQIKQKAEEIAQQADKTKGLNIDNLRNIQGTAQSITSQLDDIFTTQQPTFYNTSELFQETRGREPARRPTVFDMTDENAQIGEQHTETAKKRANNIFNLFEGEEGEEEKKEIDPIVEDTEEEKEKPQKRKLEEGEFKSKVIKMTDEDIKQIQEKALTEEDFIKIKEKEKEEIERIENLEREGDFNVETVKINKKYVKLYYGSKNEWTKKSTRPEIIDELKNRGVKLTEEQKAPQKQGGLSIKELIPYLEKAGAIIPERSKTISQERKAETTAKKKKAGQQEEQQEQQASSSSSKKKKK